LPPTGRDAFTALDSATAGPAAPWIHTSAHHAEAGYLDPSLGWVSVRADATSAGVHAALVPASPEAASVLGNHLAGLNAWLAEHRDHSATVTLAPETGGSPSSGSQPGNSTNHQQGHTQSSDRNITQPEGGSAASTSRRENSASDPSVAQPPAGIPAWNGSGVHLSVMA
jgi:hypothetical protein